MKIKHDPDKRIEEQANNIINQLYMKVNELNYYIDSFTGDIKRRLYNKYLMLEVKLI